MRTGIWLVGARGSVATTTVVGAAALRAGLVPATGCVSALEAFDGVPLPGFDELVFAATTSSAPAWSNGPSSSPRRASCPAACRVC